MNESAVAAPLVDSHAHLDFEDFDRDRDLIVQRAREAGLVAIITIGIEPADWQRTLRISATYEHVYPALGIHPNSADQTNEHTLAELWALCKAMRSTPEFSEGQEPVGIGETGLDYYREHVPHEVQRASFRAHLDLARQLDLPVIVHDRDAHRDVLEIIRSDGRGTRGVMHSFSGDLQFAEECIRLGYMVSLAGPVTFKKAADKHQIARSVPLEMLLVETDCPFLTPEPFRGRRNEPAYIAHTARAIADLRGVDYVTVAKATTANARRLFQLSAGKENDQDAIGRRLLGREPSIIDSQQSGGAGT